MKFGRKAFEFISNKEKTKVIGLSLNTIMNEMVVLTLIFKDTGEIFDIEDPNGVFCFCYNYTYPDCSELGTVSLNMTSPHISYTELDKEMTLC